MSTSKIVAIIQARLNSTRQPAKVMLDLYGKTLLQRVIDRARQAKTVDEVWVATSVEPREDVVADAARNYGVKVHRGELDDVLGRYLGAAQASGADIVARVTSDNPLTESRFIDLGIQRLLDEGLDYLDFKEIPYGAHVWLFTTQALARAADNAVDPYEREHVVPHFYNNPDKFKVLSWICPIEAIRKPEARLTLDTMDDYIRLYKVFQHR
jgi:spore coat polysaccharide biosynthesis protein SpsF